MVSAIRPPTEYGQDVRICRRRSCIEVNPVDTAPLAKRARRNSIEVTSLFGSSRKVGNYTMGRIIGSGASSFVRSGHDNLNNKQVAIKITRKKPGSKSAKNEVTALKKLDHPNIIPILTSYEDQHNNYIVMPLCSTTLLRSMDPKTPFSEEKARAFFIQLLSAVKHCHEKSIVHRDIKLDNLLISEDKQTLILSDFGLAESIDDGDEYRKSYVGTFPFCAPEIFLGKDLTGKETDVWSMGVCLYAMSTSALPFESIQEILNSETPRPSHFSNDLDDLIQKMLCKDQTQRATIEEIENHPWVNCQ